MRIRKQVTDRYGSQTYPNEVLDIEGQTAEGVTIGMAARTLQDLLYRHRVAIYLEPEFRYRLRKIAETP
jgi:hypothetical protein